MKKIIVIFCSVLGLQGFNSIGQTNSVPPAVPVVSVAPSQAPKAPSKPETPGVSAAPAPQALPNHSQVHPTRAEATRKSKRINWVTVLGVNSDRNFGADVEHAFRSGNDQMGDASIRDTVVTIFPTGR